MYLNVNDNVTNKGEFDNRMVKHSFEVDTRNVRFATRGIKKKI